MKLILPILGMLLLCNFVSAQLGYKNYSLSTGWSTSNSKLLSLAIEGSNNKKLQIGMSLDAIFYSNITSKFSATSDKTFIAMGPFVKARLGSSRNFSHQLYIGGNIGSDNANTIWYPYFGLEQSFYCSPHTQFMLGEKCLYIFRIPVNNWQPIVSIGVRYSY